MIINDLRCSLRYPYYVGPARFLHKVSSRRAFFFEVKKLEKVRHLNLALFASITSKKPRKRTGSHPTKNLEFLTGGQISKQKVKYLSVD